MKAVTNLVLVGCGAVAEFLYAPAIRQLADEGAVGRIFIIDRSLNRIESISRILRNASGHADLAEIIAELPDSLVIVAFPNDLHAQIAVTALRAGAHVLCEEPMARTTEECDLILKAASSTARLVAVGHMRRFFPVTRLIREWIADQRLGKLKSFRFLGARATSWPVVSGRQSAGGGVLIDHGVHWLDLLLWWIGPVQELEYTDDAAGGVETNCVVKFKMQSGVDGYLQMSCDWPLPERYFFDFEKGWLIYDYDVPDRLEWGWHQDHFAQKSTIEQMRGVGFDRLPNPEPITFALSDAFERQLSNVLAAIQGREPLVCPGEAGKRAIALVERCYAGRRLLAQPWLPPQERVKLESLAQAGDLRLRRTQ
jgi:predicted dehydrogenase